MVIDTDIVQDTARQNDFAACVWWRLQTTAGLVYAPKSHFQTSSIESKCSEHLSGYRQWVVSVCETLKFWFEFVASDAVKAKILRLRPRPGLSRPRTQNSTSLIKEVQQTFQK